MAKPGSNSNEPFSRESSDGHRVSIAARIGLGIVVPIVIFIGYQIALMRSLDGTGSWDGMGLAVGSLVIVPGLFVANLWVVLDRWVRRSSAFIAGMMIPAIIALVEYLWVCGCSYRARSAIDHAFIAPFAWIWLFAFVLFLPLIVSIIRTVSNKKRE